jgi:hypothetical protein
VFEHGGKRLLDHESTAVVVEPRADSIAGANPLRISPPVRPTATSAGSPRPQGTKEKSGAMVLDTGDSANAILYSPRRQKENRFLTVRRSLLRASPIAIFQSKSFHIDRELLE